MEVTSLRKMCSKEKYIVESSVVFYPCLGAISYEQCIDIASPSSENLCTTNSNHHPVSKGSSADDVTDFQYYGYIFLNVLEFHHRPWNRLSSEEAKVPISDRPANKDRRNCTQCRKMWRSFGGDEKLSVECFELRVSDGKAQEEDKKKTNMRKRLTNL